MKIVADNKIPFLKSVLEPFAEVEYLSPKDIVKEKLIDADALIVRTRTFCNVDLLEGTNVKLITTATIGYDHIDTGYCKEKNIKWVNAPGCNSTSVMQYISSALLTLAAKKKLDLTKLTLGIIGVGNVGSKVDRAARLLGMKVLLNDPPRARTEGKENFVELDKLITQSDIVTIHVPLYKGGIDKTYYMADETFFSKMKDGAIIINSSRGPVVKGEALKNVIASGKLSASVLDVWEHEPEIDLELLKMVDIATPHIAGYSSDGKANGTAVCVNAINKYFNLGMEENWYPEEIPAPLNTSDLEIDCGNIPEQEILAKAVLHTYNIMEDDSDLRNSPGSFEKLRNYYKVRREFTSYNLILKNPGFGLAEKLVKLGLL